jgi:hypothetical protein
MIASVGIYAGQSCTRAVTPVWSLSDLPRLASSSSLPDANPPLGLPISTRGGYYGARMARRRSRAKVIWEMPAEHPMAKLLRTNLVLPPMVAVFLVTAFNSFCHGADYQIHIVAPVVTDHMILHDAPLPPVCKRGDTISLAACRGEYEPGAFVVSAAQPLKDVRVEVDPMDGPGAPWPADAVDVRVVKEFYGWTLAQGEGHLAADVPILLVHDENSLVMEPIPGDKYGWKKPVAKGSSAANQLQPVQVDGHRQFWITVHVPDDAAAGVYTTELRILPTNSKATKLTLNVQVYSFNLLPSMLEYSIYYPVTLVPEGSRDWRSGAWRNTAHITPRQYLAESRNMAAHGLTNPNIYSAPTFRQDGSLSFENMDQILELRERAGMRPKVLYLAGTQILITPDRLLTDDEYKKNQDYIRQTNEWARARGYELCHLAFDEWKGEKLANAKNSMQCIHDAGGRMFAAIGSGEFLEHLGDLLDVPILGAGTKGRLSSFASEHYDQMTSLRHMPEIARAGRIEFVNSTERRAVIDRVHAQGHKIYTYGNPMAGQFLPELQRRNQGLGLWRCGFDGTMNWSYSHIASDPFAQRMLYSAVYRIHGGVIDTLHWEGFREGVDDVRYLTTLLTVLGDCAGRFPDEPLVPETYEWLRKIDIEDSDLDEIRREMARRIIGLFRLGAE